MADERAVHVLPQEEGWAVVREGNNRATSVHRTQAEAADAGRELARKDGASFLLHARDGRVRDRSDYGGGPMHGERPKGPVAAAGDAAGNAVGAAARTAGGAFGSASGALGGAIEGLAGSGQSAGQGAAPHKEEVTDKTEEADGLAYEERYAGYEVHDQLGKKVGQVDALFLDEEDELEYVGVKTDPLGAEPALVVPAEAVTVDEEQGRMVVARSSNVVERGPALADEVEMRPEFEERVRGHYRLDRAARTGTYGAYHAGPPTESAGAPTTGMGQTGTSASPGASGEEEIRVQRAEEELVAGTTRREAGALRVRKRVRTERKTIEVPVKREEVRVERVPLSGEAPAEAEIGEEEIVVPVVEEEVVISKRPVVKEEVRIRKDVVENTEVVEEDVRREEIEVEDETSTRDRGL